MSKVYVQVQATTVFDVADFHNFVAPKETEMAIHDKMQQVVAALDQEDNPQFPMTTIRVTKIVYEV